MESVRGNSFRKERSGPTECAGGLARHPGWGVQGWLPVLSSNPRVCPPVGKLIQGNLCLFSKCAAFLGLLAENNGSVFSHHQHLRWRWRSGRAEHPPKARGARTLASLSSWWFQALPRLWLPHSSLWLHVRVAFSVVSLSLLLGHPLEMSYENTGHWIQSPLGSSRMV